LSEEEGVDDEDEDDASEEEENDFFSSFDSLVSLDSTKMQKWSKDHGKKKLTIEERRVPMQGGA
jgi:hypothetical protein